MNIFTLRCIPFITAVLLLSACSQNSQPQPDNVSSSAASSQSTAPVTNPAHWSYSDETGPDHWSELESDYELCSTGTTQSPINIDHTKITPSGKVKPITLHYNTTETSVINNGHTIQVNPLEQNNTIELEGTTYTLQQFHFHHPSEHQIDGKNAAMELHLVHTAVDGSYAVVAVLIEPGKMNPAFEQIWNQMPTTPSETAVTLDQPVQLRDLLPKDLHSVHYTGSLTTPPCTEHVNWNVLETPIELSREQIERFAAIFPDNHRPVQEVGVRELYSEQN